MPVGVDEAGHDDRVSAVQRGRARRSEVFSYGEDFAVSHMNVAIGNISEAFVHRDNVASAYHELAASGQPARRSGRALAGQGRLRALHEDRARQAGESGASYAFDKSTPVDRRIHKKCRTKVLRYTWLSL